MQLKLRVLHKTFFTRKIENLRDLCRSRIVTVFTSLTRSFTEKRKKVFFFTLFEHFKAGVVRKEEELSFSVDIEEK